MATITKIRPRLPQIVPKKRVAAYARVSVETELLMHSLSNQVSHYNKLIQSNPEWEFAGVYADAGITGTSIAHREEFKRLMADCEAGKIDMVLVKSISRFARDTVDCLNSTRRLKELGVAVYFEREKINSLTADGELMLTLLASFAQEESRSISQNVKWGIRKRFQEGIQNGVCEPYGYRWDGEMYRIIPEEGDVVKEIFKRYLAGEPAYSIAKTVPIDESRVKFILANPSYTGIQVLQRNFMSEGHKRKYNKGELPMYVVDEMFEPLVSEADFEKAAEIRKKRADEMPNKNPKLTPFSGKVKCGYCGFGVSRRTSGAKKRWCCNTRERKGMEYCDCRPIDESELQKGAVEIIGTADEEILGREILLVTLYGDRVEFKLQNGRIRTAARHYSGKRGNNGFTDKVFCGCCGTMCERDNWSKGTKVWKCADAPGHCSLRRVQEQELYEAAESIFGENFQAKVVERIRKIHLFDDRLEFEFKEGAVTTWQRK